MDDAVTWSTLISVLLILAFAYAVDAWLGFRRTRKLRAEIAANTVLVSSSVEALQRQNMNIQKELFSLSARVDILARQQTQLQKQHERLTSLVNKWTQEEADEDESAPDAKKLTARTTTKGVPSKKSSSKRAATQSSSQSDTQKASVIPLRPENLSQEYREAIELAKKGYSTEQIAAHCQMSYSEAEMIVALYRRLENQ